jgi:2-iminobutanoate/2-iminopropanoate deaminase
MDIMQAISTPHAPAALGPYSQAVLADDTLYISGQLGIDPATGEMKPDFSAQAEQVFANLKAILASAGMDFAHVAKVSVFLKDMNDFPTLNTIYAGFFQAPFPARETVQVARLPKDGLVEISLIAVR